MTFRAAVRATPEIEHAWRPGLQAIRGNHRQHVIAADGRRLRGSIDLDETLRQVYPNDPRWDYAVSYLAGSGRTDETVYWIEVHPATGGDVKVVLSKLKWVKEWMEVKAPKLDEMTRVFVWVASGRTAFTQRSTQAKRLAEAGLLFTGRKLRIP